MFTFSQLLRRNTVLGLIFSLFAAVLAFVFLSDFLSAKTAQHQVQMSAIAHQMLAKNDHHELAKTLRYSANYNLLDIKTLSDEPIFNYTDSSEGFTLPFISPAINTLTLQELDLKIVYQLNVTKESKLFIQLFITISVSLFIFIIVACWISVKKYNLFFHAICQKIKNDLALIVPDSAELPVETNSPVNNFSLDIPELNEGIEEIKQIINSQLSNTNILEKEAYTDSVTQLNNRSRFVQFYEKNIVQESPIKFGVLLMTRCSELQTINQIHGYNEGDSYISTVADIIKNVLVSQPDSKIFRLNGSDFACILPNIQLKEAEAFAQDLTVNFNQYQLKAEFDSVAYSGLVYFDKSKPLGELLALADTAISVAQTQHMNSWYSQKDSNTINNGNFNYGNQNWRQEIESVIENQRISLLLQPIQPNNRNSRVYGEILARFLNANNEMLPTASFFAMAEKLDQIAAVDRLIIESVINEITSKNIVDQSFGINISPRSINDEHFMIWLERRLLRDPSIAQRLVFELSENGLQQNIKISKRFIDMIHRAGSRITVERFGVGLTSFKFFRDLKPDFIKMDSTYTRDIDEDKNNQYFLRLMVDLAHRLSISVLAESVESQEEKHTLEKLFIDGCQGFYIGKPTPL